MNVQEECSFKEHILGHFSDETNIDETALCDDNGVSYMRVICSDMGRVSDGWFYSRGCGVCSQFGRRHYLYVWLRYAVIRVVIHSDFIWIYWKRSNELRIFFGFSTFWRKNYVVSLTLHADIQCDSERWTQFRSLYLKINTSDKYDVNYIGLYLQLNLKIGDWILKQRRNALHSSRRFTNAKHLELHSSHFALNCCCCKAVQ